jgi:hypothetical protein
MEISPITLVLLTTGSTLLGVIITSFFNLRATRLAKESEERTQNKELIVRAAIENWKQVAEMVMKGRSGTIAMRPLDVFLIHMSETAKVIFDPTTNAENIEQRMERVTTLTDIATAVADRAGERSGTHRR